MILRIYSVVLHVLQMETNTSIYNYKYTGENSLEALSATDRIPNEIGLKYTFLDFYSGLSTTQKWNIGTRIDQFLIDCTFDQTFCNQKYGKSLFKLL